MDQNFNEYIKADKKRWRVAGTAILLNIVLLICMFLQLFGQGKVRPSEWFKNYSEYTATQTEPLTFEIENSPQLLLTQGEISAVTSSEKGRYLETTLTATVLPEDASNKEVFWQVEWASEKTEQDISESWQIINTDKSNIIKIRLLQRASSAVITVTTVDGGYTATATASYKIKVDSMTVSYSSYTRRALNDDNKVETTTVAFTKMGNNAYQMPLYSSEGLTIGSTKYNNQCLYHLWFSCFDYFGDKMNLANKYSDGFKAIQLNLSINGKSVSRSYFREQLDWNEFNKVISLVFICKDGFKDTLGNVSNSLDFTFINTMTNKTILSLKLYFTIPVQSVTLSPSEIAF